MRVNQSQTKNTWGRNTTGWASAQRNTWGKGDNTWGRGDNTWGRKNTWG
jgi:hypothetical protein